MKPRLFHPTENFPKSSSIDLSCTLAQAKARSILRRDTGTCDLSDDSALAEEGNKRWVGVVLQK